MHSVFETIELFVITCYGELLRGKCVPKIKFIFQDNAFKLFELVKNNHVEIIDCWTPAIEDKDIKYIRNNNYISSTDEYVVNISNAYCFFFKLTELVNAYEKYKENHFSSSKGRYIIRNYLNGPLWLKMTPYDFFDIYGFLDREIAFLKDKTFDKYDRFLNDFNDDYKVANYLDYDIYCFKGENSFWFETVNNITFKLKKDDIESYLPTIHYGIYNNTCYIYGIQNEHLYKRNDIVEADLKTLNKGIKKRVNHPAFVLVLKTFIEMLKENDITLINVPLLEVLNYDYHAQMGYEIRNRFERQWKDISNLTEDEMIEYMVDKESYDRFVGKEDLISKNKVEGLANLFYRIEKQFNNIEIDSTEFNLSVKVKKYMI